MIELNIAVVGTGSIVDEFCIAVGMIKDMNVVALYSRDIKSARVKELKETYKITWLFESLDTMLACENIDTVYIASPNSLHYSQSLSALNANKHVICEKPFTSTYIEACHLLDVAKKKQLMIFEAITTLYLPNFQIIKENLFRIGKLRIAMLNYSQYSRKYDRFLAGHLPNVFNCEFSGGCLQDINIYNVHFMTALFGIPGVCEYFPNIHENGIDTSGIMIMQYPGFTATLTGSKDTRSENFVYLQGEKGYIKVLNGSNGCQEVIIELTGEETRKLNSQYESNRLFYELQAFSEMFTGNDTKRCYELIEYSANVVKLVENARIKAGVHFAADHTPLNVQTTLNS